MRIFTSYVFNRAGARAGFYRLLSRQDFHFTDTGVDWWNPLATINDAELYRDLARRIGLADVYIYLDTRESFRSVWMSRELEVADRLGLPIVGVKPWGMATGPIPCRLAQVRDRIAGWHGPGIVRALNGEYPLDTRTFRIAETAARVRLAGMLAGGVGAISLIALGTIRYWLPMLQRELHARGIELVIEDQDPGASPWPSIIGWGGAGAGLGYLVGKLFIPEATLGLAMLGLALGTGFALHRRYKVRVVEGPVVSRLEFVDVSATA